MILKCAEDLTNVQQFERILSTNNPTDSNTTTS